MAPGGIRPRLARMTQPGMKAFVSEAVKQAKNDAEGRKLVAELNKQWATALKAFKEYDVLAERMRKTAEGLLAQGASLDPVYLDSIQKNINSVSAKLKPIAAAVSSFEKVEDLIVKKYRLDNLKVAAVKSD